MSSFIKFLFVLIASILFNIASIGNAFAESKLGNIYVDRFITDGDNEIPLPDGKWKYVKKMLCIKIV